MNEIQKAPRRQSWSPVKEEEMVRKPQLPIQGHDRSTRSQCKPCPWRDVSTIPDYALDLAFEKPEGFSCHTRCGFCPGPVLAIEAVADEIQARLIR